MLKETQVDKYVRKYLTNKDWTLTNDLRGIGHHDWDIKAFHKKWRKILLIESKGDSNSKNNTQKIHNSFWTSIGQVMARMDLQGNNSKKARIYAIAIPAHWEDTFSKKAKKMEYGWNFLKLRVFLVKNNGGVEEKTYKQFLK
ncbi:MAG: hypothetical protein WC933_02615 [Candidatus Paceibacterota bacterium]|jgi:hypothetical protein